MVDNLDIFLSHPDKTLFSHIKGVREEVQKRTTLKIADYSAIFHDLGKLNPNFQKKIRGEKIKKYSNHSYLSCLIFMAYCSQNTDELNKTFKSDILLSITAILLIISSHHKNLPNFPVILNRNEINSLVNYLKNENVEIPASNLLKEFLRHINFDLKDPKYYNNIYEFSTKLTTTSIKLINNADNLISLNYFLEILYSFSSLIISDKIDAGNYYSTDNIKDFCKSFNNDLQTYLKEFKNDNELNKIRTKIRVDSKAKLNEYLKKDKRIFSLTAPTGSGKTIILLSLAGEIIKSKGDYRIIYALPFLSITEQVEIICKSIFKNGMDNILRIDSKSDNTLFEKYQQELDDNPDTFKKILNMKFSEDTFNYPFIITTFVRLFETLLSNKNSTLIKLPNFSKTIFLVDEIQSLPPRLYGFFVAFLDSFCKKFDSYAIISTATMPNFELPENNLHNLKEFFCIRENNLKNYYSKPVELVESQIVENNVFNRYKISKNVEKIDINQLSKLIFNEKNSVLVILNTIQDTKDLYKKLNCKNSILLNTHFTVRDRILKIELAKRILQNKDKKLILISTQLIEAGVDIDFPIVYRDIAPLPNIIQSAGRCNRNGKFKEGKFVLFELIKNNLSRSNLIYKGKDKKLLEYTKCSSEILDKNEKDLIEAQKHFFSFIQENLIFGIHNNIDFIDCINNLKFEDLGKFQLIDENIYGKEFSYYIPRRFNDNKFENLEKLSQELSEIEYNNFEERKFKLIEIERLIKKMSNRIVKVRLKDDDSLPIYEQGPCFNIYKLSQGYNSKTGIVLSNENQIL